MWIKVNILTKRINGIKMKVKSWSKIVKNNFKKWPHFERVKMPHPSNIKKLQ